MDINDNYYDGIVRNVDIELNKKNKNMNKEDPRNMNERMDNVLNPFRITENSLKKCICGHSVGFHHIDGTCKGSVTDGCKCQEIVLKGN